MSNLYLIVQMTPFYTCVDAAPAITVLTLTVNLISSFSFQVTVRLLEEIESISSSHISSRKQCMDETILPAVAGTWTNKQRQDGSVLRDLEK